jgi:hypothetical protein
MGNSLKLDKWPEEIECEGWVWKKHDEKHPCGVFYAMSKKTYTPPTMREIMEHLLKGGWMRLEYKESIGLWRLNKKGELQVAWMDRGVFTIFRWKVSESIGWYVPDAKLMLVAAGPISPEEA